MIFYRHLAGVLGLLLLSQFSIAQTTARLQTATTTIELRADTSSPQLVELKTAGGPSWKNIRSESLIPYAVVDGHIQALTWHRISQSHVSPKDVIFSYESSDLRLRISWMWIIRSSSGPIEHTVIIQNVSGHEIWIPLQDSLALQLATDPKEQLKHWYIEKGADTPSAEGTHTSAVDVGYHWTGHSSTYAHPVPGESREIIPLSLVESSNGGGWYAGIEFSGRTRIALTRDEQSLRVDAGLNPDPGVFLTRLRDQEKFYSPMIFLGAFTGTTDDAGNDLRRWVRNVLGNPHAWSDPNYPVLVSNSWGAGTAVNEQQALRMIHDAADLGLEMYHLDAGWFRNVGDWQPNPEKFPHGLRAVSDAAHAAGLRFGLWVDWAQAGLSREPGALNARDPKTKDWLVTNLPPNWKPEEYKGETIDLGVPEARDWAKTETSRIVRDFGLDMLEHDGYVVAQGCMQGDHPHAPPDLNDLHVQKDAGFRFVHSANSTDVSYHATRAYYEVQQHLREQNPNLLLEICNDGGRMIDFGSAAHGDYFSITDTYDPLSNRRAFWDTSHVLPPAMLESYVEKWDTPRIENFRYMLRSGMMGWFSLMQDAATWTDEQRRTAKNEIAFYKSELRPLIRDAELYHVSERPDGVHWDGIEYLDPTRGRGVLYVFRGSTPSEAKHTFVLRGLRPDRDCRLHFRDGSAADTTVRGADLSKTGVQVALPLPNSSEIVVIEEIQR